MAATDLSRSDGLQAIDGSETGPTSVRVPTVEEWLAEVEYLAANVEADQSHVHAPCAWQPYREFYAAHGLRVGNRYEMFYDLGRPLATAWTIDPPEVRDLISRAVFSNLGGWDDPDWGGPDPFVQSMTEVRAIRDLLTRPDR